MMTAPHTIVDRLSRLLHDEIAAIGAGKLEAVRELFVDKAALMAEFEAASGQIETLLKRGGTPATDLRTQIEDLYKLIRKDQALLERMAEATGRAARELSRIRDRHGLGGLYDADGGLRKPCVAAPQQIDQSI
jgi:hypothetical protein